MDYPPVTECFRRVMDKPTRCKTVRVINSNSIATDKTCSAMKMEAVTKSVSSISNVSEKAIRSNGKSQ